MIIPLFCTSIFWHWLGSFFSPRSFRSNSARKLWFALKERSVNLLPTHQKDGYGLSASLRAHSGLSCSHDGCDSSFTGRWGQPRDVFSHELSHLDGLHIFGGLLLVRRGTVSPGFACVRCPSWMTAVTAGSSVRDRIHSSSSHSFVLGSSFLYQEHQNAC